MNGTSASLPAPASPIAQSSSALHFSRVLRWARSGLGWGAIAALALSLWILFGLGGRAYYLTPLGVRAYASAHRLLKPSGPAGQTFGLIGTVLMLVPFAYMARKRIRRVAAPGTLKGWLEVHLFCGVVGPVLVTFHTSFKFNGIISAAYWSMVAVVLSGFVGRFLFVRIPRSIRGVELTRAELDARAADLHTAIVESSGDTALLTCVTDFEQRLAPRAGARGLADLFFGELGFGRRLRRFERDLIAGGMPESHRRSIVDLAAERALTVRRAAYLQQTRKFFELWHVFHLPLVYLLLLIAAAHIALVIYMGYVPFRWS